MTSSLSSAEARDPNSGAPADLPAITKIDYFWIEPRATSGRRHDSVSYRSRELFAVCERDRFRSIRGAGFPENVGDMDSNGIRTDVQLPRYLLVGLASNEQVKNLDLPVCQPGWFRH
jgi:hypothetical protein